MIKSNKQDILKVEEPAELLKFLIAKFPNRSRKLLKSVLGHRQILVDNKIVTQFNHPLRKDQEVMVNWYKLPDVGELEGINILYEDKDIIVIDKHAGILSMATEQGNTHTAYHLLSDHVKKTNAKNRIFIVHRLDRDTSGVMLFAKTFNIQQVLQSKWTDVVTERTYLAVTEGCVEKQEDTLVSWLKENTAKIVYASNLPNDGQKAVTHYKVLKQNELYSLLEVHLETGRKNQIRVQLKEIGHSIVGDEKYGSTSNPIKRLGLHAYILAFKHPITNKVLRFETNIPKKFSRLF